MLSNPRSNPSSDMAVTPPESSVATANHPFRRGTLLVLAGVREEKRREERERTRERELSEESEK